MLNAGLLYLLDMSVYKCNNILQILDMMYIICIRCTLIHVHFTVALHIAVYLHVGVHNSIINYIRISHQEINH